jgi:hypothetical protein
MQESLRQTRSSQVFVPLTNLHLGLLAVTPKIMMEMVALKMMGCGGHGHLLHEIIS